jgi:hypothetical protein
MKKKSIFKSFLEEVAVTASTFKAENFVICGVNQNPIRLDMAVPAFAPSASERVVAVFWIERQSIRKYGHDVLELDQILTPLCHAFRITCELPGLGKAFHVFQLANMSDSESNA